MEDKKIVDLFWQRDENAITVAAAKYGRYCNTIANNILHNAYDAEECVNDTYIGAWNSMPDNRPERLGHYLGKMTRWIALNRLDERRSQIPDGHGGLKRCPCRVPNPGYIPGGTAPKTLPVCCHGCEYEEFRQAHTTIVISSLDHETEAGEFEPFEIPALKDLTAADRYLELREEFVAFIRLRNPKLAPLAENLTLEFTKSEAARELGDAWGTVTSRVDKLKELVAEFLDNIATP